EKRSLIARQYALARPRITAKTERIFTLTLPAADARARIDATAPPKPSRRAAVLARLQEKRQISDEEAQRLAGSRANLERLVRTGHVCYDREGHSLMLAMSREEAAEEQRKLTQPKRAAEAHATIDALSAGGDRTARELRAAGASTETSDWLVTLGVLTARDQPVERDPLEHVAVARRPP